MLRVFGFSFGCLLLLGSCTQKLICPAYQSAFIYDQEALRKKFSYFKEDSTPKLVTVSKNKYLIIPEQSYRKKIKSMKTVEMKPVKVILPDSLQPNYEKNKNKKDNEFHGAEQEAGDSTAVKRSSDSTSASKPKVLEDSAYAITKDKEVRVLKYDRDSAKYHIVHITLNADQDNYMWYFRDLLVLPDVRAALEDQKRAKAEKAANAKPKKEKKGFFNFLKNIFKKKQKPDSTKLAGPLVPPIDSDDPNDSTAALSAPEVKATPPAKKKGLFGLFGKKKPKQPKKEPDAATTPPEQLPDKKDLNKKDVKKEGEGF